MRTDITHLPEQIQTELTTIVQFLSWPKKVAELPFYFNDTRVRYLILHGCFTEDYWKPDTEMHPHQTTYSYNIMVIISHNEEGLANSLDKVETALNESGKLSFPLSLHVCTHKKLNRKLESGYFAYDQVPIRGIQLYTRCEPKEVFTIHEIVCAEKHHLRAQGHFNRLFALSRSFLEVARLFQNRMENNISVFMLNMSAEQAYLTFMLVHVLHHPSTSRSMEKIRELAESIHPELHVVWSGSMAQESFKLLTDSFWLTRHSLNYNITDEELALLFTHVEDLQKVVHYICQNKLATLKSGSLEKGDKCGIGAIKAAIKPQEVDFSPYDEIGPFCKTEEQMLAYAKLGNILFDMTIPLFDMDNIAGTMKCMVETGKQIAPENISMMGEMFQHRAREVKNATDEMLDLWREARSQEKIVNGFGIARLGG